MTSNFLVKAFTEALLIQGEKKKTIVISNCHLNAKQKSGSVDLVSALTRFSLHFSVKFYKLL